MSALWERWKCRWCGNENYTPSYWEWCRHCFGKR